ncbi:MAG: helix-turn-helix domain-containing protein [Lachnospiraceae bacterium]|nr:helix-turn-helix domain-containing protein [Lachnospiraceae bacterium]
MRIFAIRDDYIPEDTGMPRKDLAWLFYYEREKMFFTELPDDADPWETPLLLSSFAERGEKTVGSYWSLRWVQQRIVPPDRQNIGMILRDNGLREYDEFGLLMLAMGRCAQDDCYLTEIKEADLPESVRRRFLKRVEDVVPLSQSESRQSESLKTEGCQFGNSQFGSLQSDGICSEICESENFQPEKRQILVFFCDGTVKKYDLGDYFAGHPEFQILTERRDYFERVRPQTGGYGVTWDVNLNISDAELNRMGTEIPLTAGDFKDYVMRSVVNTAEACELLACSRQNINDLVKRGKLHPVKVWERTTLFWKSEVMARKMLT